MIELSPTTVDRAHACGIRPAIRRIRTGHWLSLATALMLIVGAVAKVTSTPSLAAGDTDPQA